MTRGSRRARSLALAAAVLAVALGVTLVPEAPAFTPAPPAAPAPAAFSFAAGGDMGYNPMAAATVKGIAGAGVDFALHLGDMAYDQIYPESAWCDFIKDPRNGVGPNFPYQIVTGGHDLGKGPGPAAQYRTLIDKYTACMPDRMGSTGTYGKEYFFDHPKAAPLMRVIMISASITTPDGITWDYKPGNARWQWLLDAIDGARAAGIRWVAVGMARNCISTGEKSCEIGVELFNLLVDKRVDLILQAHEHGYARSRQLSTGPKCAAIPVDRVDPACFADDGTTDNYAKGAGSVVVIAGTLGIGMRPMNLRDAEAGAFRAIMGSNINRTHGFMKYTVTPDRIQAQFVATTNGGFGDQFTIADANPDRLPRPTPTGPPPPAGRSPTTTPVGEPAPGPAPANAVRPVAVGAAGYWMLGADGAVYAFGDAGRFGAASVPAGRAAVDLEPTPSGRGAWVLDDTGAVTPFGDAPALG
ncbi:MAG TPA: hypothetical protein VEG38_01250, partial [Acidimicrobiia bacterium]|nr:hypothetical protein [Acidimicrobiia bacterium]